MRRLTNKPTNEQAEYLRAIEARIALNALLELSLAPLNLKDLLDNALNIILTIPCISKKDQGAIFVYSKKNRFLELISSKNLSKKLLSQCSSVSLGDCFCGLAGLKKEIIYRNHTHNTAANIHSTEEEHGHYCVPILLNNALLGVLNLYVEHDHKPNKAEEALLSTIAITLAGIIDKKQIEEIRAAERQLCENIIIAARKNRAFHKNKIRYIQTAADVVPGDILLNTFHENGTQLYDCRVKVTFRF